MEGKERFDASIEQAKFWYGLFDGRRNFEWKITVGFWAAILGVTSEFAGGKITEHWLNALIIIFLHTLWLRGVWVAHENDKMRFRHFIVEAENAYRKPNIAISPSPNRIKQGEARWWIGFLGDWSMVFQLLVTIGLVVNAFNVLGCIEAYFVAK